VDKPDIKTSYKVHLIIHYQENLLIMRIETQIFQLNLKEIRELKNHFYQEERRKYLCSIINLFKIMILMYKNLKFILFLHRILIE